MERQLLIQASTHSRARFLRPHGAHGYILPPIMALTASCLMMWGDTAGTSNRLVTETGSITYSMAPIIWHRPARRWINGTLSPSLTLPIMCISTAMGVQYTLGIAPTCPSSNTDFNFGGGATGVMSGLITEVHVSSVVRSAGWNSTEYQNHNSPSTFYTVTPTMAQRPATSSPIVSSISRTVGSISGGTSVTITGT